MALLDGLLPGWARTIANSLGSLLAGRVKQRVDEEVEREKLARDAAADNAKFAEERAAREVATGKPGPK
jgi:hypothetical protein